MFPVSAAALASFSHPWKSEEGTTPEAWLHTRRSKWIGVISVVIPIISALFPVTLNKNVDRINYVHYNVQRLVNLTRDAV